jgi:hypothetical protein
MKLTLDHNVIIDLANRSSNAVQLRQAIGTGTHEAFVVEIGASEMRQRGIKPDRYDLFEQLLEEAGIDAAAPRLSPMLHWDVTFWDHALWVDDDMSAQAKRIEDILFGESMAIDITGEPDDSPKVAAWLNRLCDVQTVWCHLRSGNDVFVTSDRNFLKATKLPRLLALGAGRVCLADEL